MRIIVIDGNIGAGKSTAVTKISKLFKNFKIFIEPSFENPFLEKYYQNPEDICYDIEKYLIESRIKTYKTALELKKKGVTVILDRSIYSSFQFLDLNYKYEKNLSESSYIELKQKIDDFVEKVDPPDLIINLKCNPKICFDRIHDRSEENTNLECENFISIEYLRNLDTSIKDWIEMMKNRFNVQIKSYNWNNFDANHNYTQMLK